MTTEPRYQAMYFPGLGCVFDAVTADGSVHTIAGVTTAWNWTINQCREYAVSGGFARETIQRIDGQPVWHWHREL